MFKNDLKNIIVEYLVDNLGRPKVSYSQLKFNCPHCDRGHKYNLEINLQYLVFHCWSCHYKGYMTNLLRDYGKNNNWRQIEQFKSKSTSVNNTDTKVVLPNGLIPFYLKKEALDYLTVERNLNKEILIERKVSYVYAEDDPFYNKLIFPFYDETGTKLVGFTSHDLKTKKYRNHGRIGTMIPYIEFINPNFPVILTEGIYDALSVYNAIPCLNTKPNKKIIQFCKDKNIITGFDSLVPNSELQLIIKDLKLYGAELIYLFKHKYEDLNDYRQKDESGLINDYKKIINLILQNKNEHAY